MSDKDSSGGDATGAKFSEAWAYYDRVRRRIVEEDGVINHRMMWGTLAQTALFAGLGLATFDATGNIQALRRTISIAVSLGGLSLSLLMLVSIGAALTEIGDLTKLYNKTFATYDAAIQAKLLPLKSSRKRHAFGHALALLLPVALLALWGFILKRVY